MKMQVNAKWQKVPFLTIGIAVCVLVILLILICVMFSNVFDRQYTETYVLYPAHAPEGYDREHIQVHTVFNRYPTEIMIVYEKESAEDKLILKNYVDSDFQDLFETNKSGFVETFCVPDEVLTNVRSDEEYMEIKQYKICKYYSVEEKERIYLVSFEDEYLFEIRGGFSSSELEVLLGSLQKTEVNEMIEEEDAQVVNIR